MRPKIRAIIALVTTSILRAEMQDDVLNAFKGLKVDVEALSKVAVKRDALFVPCLRSSLVKAYEFVDFAYVSMTEDVAFHCTGGLRSICEDLIVLKFMAGLNAKDRNTLIYALMQLDVAERLETQCQFLHLFHFGQPVLRRQIKPEARAELERKGLEALSRGGFNLKKLGVPQTKQLAGKIGDEALVVLYDFMFDVTSSVVHFSPTALLKMGWGENNIDMTFSPKNLGKYYLSYCRIYGVFLLTVYFEFFPTFIPAAAREKARDLRKALVMEHRWPEMVTYEEMNRELPNFDVFSVAVWLFLAEQYQDGFVKESKKVRERMKAVEPNL